MTELDAFGEIELALPHDFEVEIRCLVTENHQITQRGIQQCEHECISHLEKELAGEDQEMVSSAIRDAETFFEDLQRAANHTALVALVTRLDHWTRKFAKQLSLKRSPVVRAMKALNVRLGAAPIPVQFFEDIVTARDSVIHHDSDAQWKHQGKIHRVADKYANAYGKLDLTEQQLREAIDNVTMQVKWYDEQIAALTPATSGLKSVKS